MAKSRRPPKKSSAAVKAAADRAEARAKGEPVEESVIAGPLNPSEVKPKIGRPTKYDPAMCEVVMNLGEEGKSKAQIARSLGVTRETIDIWAKEHAAFSDAIKTARELALAWWEDRGQEGLLLGSKGFNATAFIFQMKNRFREDYRDASVHEHSGKDGGPIETKETSDIETARRIAFMLGRAVGRKEAAGHDAAA